MNKAVICSESKKFSWEQTASTNKDTWLARGKRKPFVDRRNCQYIALRDFLFILTQRKLIRECENWTATECFGELRGARGTFGGHKFHTPFMRRPHLAPTSNLETAFFRQLWS